MLPEKYLNEMKQLLNEDYDKYLSSFNDKPVSSIRINEYKKDNLSLPFEMEKVPFIHNGYYVNDETIGKNPYYDAGAYYIQEASAMTPAENLPIEEGDFVLDICAAPGGKTTELLSKLNGTGLLVANDISVSRCYPLAKNIQRMGFDNFFVTAHDGKDLESHFREFFDKILVDAPCSGEGMFRKDKSLINSWIEKDSDFYPPIQKEILQSAINMLKPGGKLLYSTCTYAQKENEEVIKHILNNNPDIHTIQIPNDYKDFVHGINLDDARRLYPFKIKGEGHFLCLLEKDGITKPDSFKQQNSVKLNKEAENFIKDLKLNTRNRHYRLIKDELYLVPSINTEKLRIIVSGLHLGTMKNDHFTPSNALAHHLKSYKHILNLDGIELNKFMKGETINCPETLKGHVLVCYNNLPLGFGKASNGILKNKNEKGWLKCD